MAANVTTGLAQVIDGHFTLSQMRAALNLSTWTEDLAWKNWSAFNKLVEAEDVDGIVNHAKSIISLYKTVWNLLDQPRTREEWLDRRFDGAYKWYNLKLQDGQILQWNARNPASAILSHFDVWGNPAVVEYKRKRNKRWIPVQ